MKKNNYLSRCIMITISTFIVGAVIDKSFIGALLFCIACINVYTMSQGKWYNYVFGILYTCVDCIIELVNHHYGAVIFSIILYQPLQIIALINWFKHTHKDTVLTNSLTWKNRIILFAILILGSLGFGLLLNIIPSQNIAFLDSTCQILNISANIMMLLRFKESWLIWILTTCFDVTTWVITYINGGQYSLMMVITSVMFLIMNIYGFVNWLKINRKQNLEENQI